MRVRIQMEGKTFGRYLVLSNTKKQGTHTLWECLCSCGSRKFVLSSHLRSGHTKSCGCLVADNNVKRLTTHGGSKSNLYKRWANMHDRCTNKSRPEYARYGGRGITVCKEWDEFAPFRDWSLANGYKKELTIDRIDNDKGYSPDNCRWTTNLVQSRNKQRSINFNGEDSISVSARLGGSEHLIHSRIYAGWSKEEAFTSPMYLASSGLKGAYYDKRDKRWYSRIYVNGKNLNLGRFGTKEEAAQAFKKAAKTYGL